MAISDRIIKHQKWWLLGLALLIIILSVVTTLWFRGALSPSWGDAKYYQNITLTDAVITCENEIRSMYKSRLRHLTMDNLSSRYDNSLRLYRVFFLADVQVGKDSTVASTHFLLSCLVGARKGNVINLEAMEKKESSTEPGRKRDGGIFGWP